MKIQSTVYPDFQFSSIEKWKKHIAFQKKMLEAKLIIFDEIERVNRIREKLKELKNC